MSSSPLNIRVIASTRGESPNGEFLSSWRILRVADGLRVCGSPGLRPSLDEVHCSAPIVGFNFPDRSVVTASGRLYELVGCPAKGLQADGLQAVLLMMTGMVGRDVTHEYLERLSFPTLQ